MYNDKILKRFKMENAKKDFLPMSHGTTYSKNQCPKTVDERVKMSGVPYASAIGSSCMLEYVLDQMSLMH